MEGSCVKNYPLFVTNLHVEALRGEIPDLIQSCVCLDMHRKGRVLAPFRKSRTEGVSKSRTNLAAVLSKHLSFRVSYGMRFGDWLSCLVESRGRFPRYFWPNLFYLGFQSFLNELMYREEEHQLGALIDQVEPPAPLFILGHWRSGTSMLHQLLSADSRFSFPSALQTHNPHTFFFLEGRLRGSRAKLGLKLYLRWADLMWGPLPERWGRPSDGMLVGQCSPDEDENALRMMKLSPEFEPMFLVLEQRHEDYGSLRDLDSKKLSRWKVSWSRFLKKLTLRYKGAPLVLKSPYHTARVKFILELFPKAKFIHIHRHPFEVFQSYKWIERVYRSTPPTAMNYEMEDSVFLESYDGLYSVYLEDRDLIPAGQLHELRYENLCAEPLYEMARAYEALGLPEFEQCRESMERHVVDTQGHRRNVHVPLSSQQKQNLHHALRRYFMEFGYAP